MHGTEEDKGICVGCDYDEKWDETKKACVQACNKVKGNPLLPRQSLSHFNDKIKQIFF